MPEKSKDSTIKLFGKTIPLSEKPPKAVVPASTIANIFATSECDDDNINNCKVDHPSCYTNSLLEENRGKGREYEKDIIADKLMKSEQEVEDPKEDRSKQTDNAPLIASEEFANSEAIYGSSDKRNTLPIGNESSAFETCKIDEDRSETSNPEEKTLKLNKVLPCPRCNSLDTKFCYYNNYNVSQPRHFCKHCQRYWTAGGTMRNVPVGAGRRKSKHSSSHCRRVIVSEPLQNARNDETMCNTTQNRFHKPEELNIHVSYRCGENGVEHRSSVSTSNNDVGKGGSQDQTMKNFQSFPPHMPCFPGFFLPCSWNSTRWSSRVPPPTFCPPSFPMPFYPAAPYWGCTIPSTWNVPWLTQPSSETLTAPSSASNSPLLGKHSRDENLSKPSSNGEDVSIKENDDERCPWIPKTLRIDHLVTSGSKNDKSESVGNRRHVKGFQSEGDERNQVLETSQILQVNPAPAALSR